MSDIVVTMRLTRDTATRLALACERCSKNESFVSELDRMMVADLADAIRMFIPLTPPTT